MKMRIIFVTFIVYLASSEAKAWYTVRNPFQFIEPEQKVHHITECMDVRSDEGIFKYVKVPRFISSPKHSKLIDVAAIEDGMQVCGLFLFTDPDKIIEIHIRQLDVDCEFGGLISVFDGWEMNGKYFPSTHDHPLSLEQRSNEFCNDRKHYPSYRTVYRSNQNAALIQYRIPVKGSFTITVRHLRNPEPCNILAQPDLSPSYQLSNYGGRKNCTLSTVFPAVINILEANIGSQVGKPLNYDCESPFDRLVVGGSNSVQDGPNDMEILTNICGKSKEHGAPMNVFCEYTTIRLVSSGKYQNDALITIGLPSFDDEYPLTLFCQTPGGLTDKK